ncbi:MAG TPA: 3-hydroxyisobutyrate dehydrogenase [Chloroflexota bacterium]|nr:3-hydroxyisobutyrate dehydrogenase [Chloroflexota bacterium]
MAERVGFVGIGTMGTPMTLNLLKAGFAVAAYDIVPAGVETVVKAGAKPADSLREVAQASDVIITMLPSPVELEAAMYGPSGLLAHLKTGQNLIDMSTMDPVATRKVAADAAKIGVGMIDAPVSGGTVGAVNGTLTIMVGGPVELLERYRPVLLALGQKLIHTGDVGSGETAKLCNNLIAGITQAAVAEAYGLAERAGLDPKVLYDIVRQSTGQCWSHDNNPPLPGLRDGSPANNEYAPGFMVDLMAKDLGLAVSTARRYGASALLTATVQQLFAAASSQGHGRQDASAVKFAVDALSKDA